MSLLPPATRSLRTATPALGGTARWGPDGPAVVTKRGEAGHRAASVLSRAFGGGARPRAEATTRFGADRLASRGCSTAGSRRVLGSTNSWPMRPDPAAERLWCAANL